MKLAKAFAEIDSADNKPAETKIVGYMPIGSIDGSGSIAISAQEIVVPSREIVFHGVRFEVTSGDEYPRENVTVVSIEDAARLLLSLEELGNARISTDRFALSEVSASVDDLKVTVFNTSQGRILAAVSSDGTTCHLHRQSELLNLHKLIDLALKHLHGCMPT